MQIPLKQWLYEQAAREGVTPNTIHRRLLYGKRKQYHLRLLRVNKRVIYVIL